MSLLMPLSLLQMVPVKIPNHIILTSCNILHSLTNLLIWGLLFLTMGFSAGECRSLDFNSFFSIFHGYLAQATNQSLGTCSYQVVPKHSTQCSRK